MVGANQAQGVMRKQNVTRLPATRFHFLNDVAESVIEFMVKANTSELAAAQNGIPFYPQPHLAHLGTRHRFNAEMIWFHNNTDHMPFIEAPIGVPGITFTNMPDHYIHSSDDDLWNIDRTQLGRSAASVALIAYAMASADTSVAPVLAANTVGRGLERLARNLRLGLTWIAEHDDATRAYGMAADQVWYAAERERMAVRSLGGIAPSVAGQVTARLQDLGRWEQEALRQLGSASVPQLLHRTGDAELDYWKQHTLEGMGEQALEGCVEVLARKGDAGTRSVALCTLQQIRDARAAYPVVRMMGDPQVGMVAAFLAGRMGEVAVEPLLVSLRDESPVVRARAALALADLREARAVEPLRAMLSDADPSVREAAGKALERLASPAPPSDAAPEPRPRPSS